MPLLTERDYAKLAAAAAKDLVEHKIPLNDSIDKLAQSHGLNPDQLSRLCEATNNQAFNALFEAEGKQGSEDRLVEFDVAKPSEILKGRVSQSKTASLHVVGSPAFDAAWESRPLRSASLVPFEEEMLAKTASIADPELVPKAPSPRAVEQALEHLRVQKIAEAHVMIDKLDELVRMFRPMYAREKFAAFEQEAMTLHGSRASEGLDHLREQLRMSAVTRDYTKTAGKLVVSDKTPEHALFKGALESFDRLVGIQTALRVYGAA